MNKRSIIYYVGVLALTLGMFSCSDYLDKDEDIDTTLSYEQIFKNTHTAPGFLNNAYRLLPDGFRRGNNESEMLASASDEARHSQSGGFMQYFNTNAISPSANPDEVWASMYEGIRKCNIFLKEIQPTGLIVKYNSIKDVQRSNYKGQAYFLRAFFHFELLKRYQNIIYLDDVLSPYDEEEVFSKPQISFKEAVDRIALDCDSAISLLPAKIEVGDLGRPAIVAPMALKARMFLYAASPLNNPTNDVELWKKAEAAAAEIYNKKGTFGVDLLGKGSYAQIFTTPYNAEIIFASKADARNDIEKNNFPISFQGKGLTNPTQNLVDLYAVTSTSYADPKNGYDPNQPYQKMEDRFYATFFYDGMKFKDGKVETFVGGKDGLNSSPTATKTGYYLKKFTLESIDLEKNQTSNRPWILFRYAEVILNYAEARNETLSAPDKTVHDLLNLIRNRAGLRPFRNANEYIKDKNEMREYIKLERRKELAFEEHRFWDLRRWKDSENLGGIIKGMKIEREGNGVDNMGTKLYKYTYTPFDLEKRVFESKLYWYPIRRSEILKYKSKGITLQQNPGWGN